MQKSDAVHSAFQAGKFYAAYFRIREDFKIAACIFEYRIVGRFAVFVQIHGGNRAVGTETLAENAQRHVAVHVGLRIYGGYCRVRDVFI